MNDERDTGGQVPELADDEKQVLSRIAEGKQIGEIAAQMGISEDQASLIISRLVKSLGVFGSAELVEQARRKGYLPAAKAAASAGEPGPAGSAPELADDEKQVLSWIAEGKQIGEIAAQMGISEDQASLIISRLVKSLGVFGSAELVEQARRKGYLPAAEAAPPGEEPVPVGEEMVLPSVEAALPGEEPGAADEEEPLPAAEAALPDKSTIPLAAETTLAGEEPPLPTVEAALPGEEPGAADEEEPALAAEAALPDKSIIPLAAETTLAGEEPPLPTVEAAPPGEEPGAADEESILLAAEAALTAERSRGRWHPLLIALLNLTGLGIGYLFLKRPLRWLFHAAITIGLLVAAYLTNASHYPLLWRIGLGAWLAWMAVDGWWTAHRQEWSTRRPWLPAAAAVVLIGLEVAGVWFYQDVCMREFVMGMIDYQQGDCRTAMDRFDLVGSACELTLSSNVPAAEDRYAECSPLRDAADARQAGRFEQAITGYQVYLAAYPGGGLVANAREDAAATYGEWAGALRSNAEWEAAIDKYEASRSAFPGAPAAEQAPALAAETFGQWADQLHQEGQFGQAIEKYETILADYADTPAGAEAATLAAQAYADWAAQLHVEGRFDQAVEKYEAILAGYADTPAGSGAAILAAQAYADWAAQLHAESQFDQAVEKYEAILANYADTPAGAQAAGLAAETHADWAAQLREEGDYEAAVANYQAIVDRYPDVPAASQAPAKAAETYRDWAGQLRGQADYALAAEKYQIILDQYPSSELAPEARESLAGTLYEWAEGLRASRDYEAAVEHYRTILSDFSASQVISQAVESLAWTTYDWGRSLQDGQEYSQALDRYEEILADPRLSAVVTETADAALDTALTWTAVLSTTNNYSSATAAGLRAQAVASQERLAEASTLLAHVYWAWGNSYAAAKNYSSAIDKYDLALNDAGLKPYASGVAEAAAAAYYAWGQSQGKTDDALKTYATLRQRFPKSKWASQAAEQAASIYVERADAQRKAGKYADAISAYEKVIRDYPNTKAAGQARTGLDAAEAAWRRSLADKLLAAISTAQKGADELNGIYATLSKLFGSISCSKIRGVAFGDTKLTVPDRFPSLQTAYRNYRDALSLLEAAKKILTDKCPGTATSSMLSSGKSKISSAKSKLSAAKQAAEAAK